MTPSPMTRRSLLAALLATAATTTPAGAAGSNRKVASTAARPARRPANAILPDSATDQSAALQQAIDEATSAGQSLVLPAGRIFAHGLKLRPGLSLRGQGPRTVLELNANGPLLAGNGAHGLRLESLVLRGAGTLLGPDHATGLVHLTGSSNIAITDIAITGSAGNGLMLERCSGRVSRCSISRAAAAGLASIDATGLEIESNRISDCANNGILVWRSALGEDGTRIAGNRIERIGALAGGTGQNGNGINIFRAGGVLATGNRIVDCAYSAIRANAASNVQIVSNSCQRLGEVALYAEFGFEGALIANNLVDGAASGIAVTNFDVGGRLAVIQGNLIRNLTGARTSRKTSVAKASASRPTPALPATPSKLHRRPASSSAGARSCAMSP